jgi:putative tricarboxylic transport membrane protein
MTRKMTRSAVHVLAAALIATAAGCGMSASASALTPSKVEIVVDTGPGGGSDVFARKIIQLLQQAHLISGDWTVNDQSAGEGLGAMAYLREQENNDGEIAFFTTKWIVDGLTTKNAPARLSDLVTLASLVEEPEIIAVSAKSPYQTMNDFIAAAKAHPNQFTSTGGAPTSIEHLTELAIQQETGTQWKYLSYAGNSARIAALLRGDAQIMVGAPDDFGQFVKAGQLLIIASVTADRLAEFPDAPTLKQQGLQGSHLPDHLQFRGIAGAPGMSQAAIEYYHTLFGKLVQTPGWKSYIASLSDTTLFQTGSDLQATVNKFTQAVQQLISMLPSDRL